MQPKRFWFSIIKQRGKFLFALILITLPGIAYSNTEITPFFSIRQSLVDNETDTLDESGYITTLVPGVSMVSEGARSNIQLDYLINASKSRDLDQDDREVHELDFISSYQHIPGRWVSSLRASSQLTNIDVNGVQGINPDINDDNSEELRTVAFNTIFTDRVTDKVQYRASLNADYADFADSEEDNTEGQGFQLELDNFRALNKFIWSTRLNSQVYSEGDNEQQIDTLNLNFRYRLNKKWSPFIDLTRTETDFSEFDDENKLFGLIWQPSSRTSVSLGAGRRNDDESYSLDAVHTVQHLSFSALYAEEITTSREYTLSQQLTDPLAQSTTLSLSIIPVLQKRAALNFAVTGRRTVFRTSIFQTDRSAESSGVDEKITGVRISLSREISASDNFSLSLLGQETEDLEDSDLANLTLSWAKSHSDSETFNFSLSWTNQDSTQDSNEYERVVASAEYRLTF
jgi:hypothetical protein